MNGSLESRPIEKYLKELNAELRDLPRARRNEIVSDIREHITGALDETQNPSRSDVLNVLERLGDPAEIAREARERFGVARARAGWREKIALVLLPLGGLLIPFIGWLIGVVLLWSSDVWTLRHKLVGTLVLPGGLFFLVYVLLMPSGVCSSSSARATCSGVLPIPGPLLLILLVGAEIASVVYLSKRMNQQARSA